MKPFLLTLLGLLLVGCGEPGPGFQCDETGFGLFESELPVNCDVVRRNTRIAFAFLVTPSTDGQQAYPFTLDEKRARVPRKALPRDALVARMQEVSVTLRASEVVCSDADGCFYALTDSIELAASMSVLVHEMLHAWEQRDFDGRAGAVRLGAHHHWEEKGYNALADIDGLYRLTIEDVAREFGEEAILRR